MTLNNKYDESEVIKQKTGLYKPQRTNLHYRFRILLFSFLIDCTSTDHY